MSDNSDDIGRQLRRFKQGLKVRAPGSETKLPILQTALLGWREGFRALGQMPKMATKAFVAVVVCLLPALAIARHIPMDTSAGIPIPIDTSVGIEFFRFGLSILQVFFLAPVAIAVHRYVLLDEITETYFPDLASSRFRHFVVAGVLLQAIASDRTVQRATQLSVVLACSIFRRAAHHGVSRDRH